MKPFQISSLYYCLFHSSFYYCCYLIRTFVVVTSSFKFIVSTSFRFLMLFFHSSLLLFHSSLYCFHFFIQVYCCSFIQVYDVFSSFKSNASTSFKLLLFFLLFKKFKHIFPLWFKFYYIVLFIENFTINPLCTSFITNSSIFIPNFCCMLLL